MHHSPRDSPRTGSPCVPKERRMPLAAALLPPVANEDRRGNRRQKTTSKRSKTEKRAQQAGQADPNKRRVLSFRGSSASLIVCRSSRRVPLAAALGRQCRMTTDYESEAKTAKRKDRKTCPTSGSSRPGQAAGFRPTRHHPERTSVVHRAACPVGLPCSLGSSNQNKPALGSVY